MNFCEPDIEDYSIRTCGIDFAGISGIGFIHLDESPTNEQLESSDFWLSKNEEDPLKYFIIRNTRGEYLGGEVIEEEDLEGPRVVGVNHSAMIESTGLHENWEFWDKINKHLWKIVFVNSGGLMFYVDKPTSVHSKINNPKNVKTGSFYQTDLKWHDLSNPFILEAPEGLFFGIEPVISDNVFDYSLDFTI